MDILTWEQSPDHRLAWGPSGREGSSHCHLIFPVAKGPLGDLLIKNAV